MQRANETWNTSSSLDSIVNISKIILGIMYNIVVYNTYDRFGSRNTMSK